MYLPADELTYTLLEIFLFLFCAKTNRFDLTPFQSKGQISQKGLFFFLLKIFIFY